MNKQTIVDESEYSSEFLNDIKRGMHDHHLGHMFSGRLVWGSFKSTGGRLWVWYRFMVGCKLIWWRIKMPWQKLVTHRNCPQCIEYNRVVY